MDNTEREWIFLKDVIKNPQHLIVAGNIVEPDVLSVNSSIIYKAVLSLLKRGEEVSFEAVAIELDQDAGLVAIGGTAFLNTLKSLEFTPTDSVFFKMCEEIARTGKATQVKKLLTKISNSESENPEELIAETINSLYKIIDIERNDLIDLDTLLKARKPRVPIASTTLSGLDAIIGGFVECEYTIIAARPSVGKTSLCNQISLISAYSGVPTLVISLEQSRTSLGNRYEKLIAHYDIGEDIIEHIPLYLNTTSGLNMQQIFYKIQMAKLLYGVRLVIIDYVGLIAGRKTTQSANDFIQQVSRQMQIISRRLDVALIVASQLNRNSETEGREPQLYDLRDSGALEQDVDNAIFIHRPKLREDADIIVAKGREVGIGRCKVKFDSQAMMFVE